MSAKTEGRLCAGKVRYASKRDAATTRNRLNEEGRGHAAHDGGRHRLRIYPCPHCGGWHLKHQKHSDRAKLTFGPGAFIHQLTQMDQATLHPTPATLTCVYCGQAYPPGTPTHGSQVAALTSHIRTCKAHPLAKALDLLRRLAVNGPASRSDIESLLRNLQRANRPELDQRRGDAKRRLMRSRIEAIEMLLEIGDLD